MVRFNDFLSKATFSSFWDFFDSRRYSQTMVILLLEGTILEYFMAYNKKLVKLVKNRGHNTQLSQTW